MSKESKRLLILGLNNGHINPKIIETAKEMGIHSTVVCFDVNKCIELSLADDYWVQDLRDYDLLLKECQYRNFDGIYGGGDTLGTLALKLSKDLNLPYYCDEKTWEFSRNKALFKKKCQDFGIPTAKRYHISEKSSDEEFKSIKYPVIVKPIDESGNHGFSYCNDEIQLKKGIEKAKEISRSGQFLVEHMLEGLEYGAFYVCADGEYRLFNFWSMHHQPGTPKNMYEINTSVTDKLKYYLENIDQKIRKMMKDIGCRDGVVWFEFMSDVDGELYALEMGERLSGEMMYVPLYKLTGFDCIKHMINYAINGKNDICSLPQNQIEYWENGACGYILWTKKGGKFTKEIGAKEINSMPGISINKKYNVGNIVIENGYGVIFSIVYENVEDLCNKIRFINENYRMIDENGEDLLIYYDQFDYLKQLDKKRN